MSGRGVMYILTDWGICSAPMGAIQVGRSSLETVETAQLTENAQEWGLV